MEPNKSLYPIAPLTEQKLWRHLPEGVLFIFMAGRKSSETSIYWLVRQPLRTRLSPSTSSRHSGGAPASATIYDRSGDSPGHRPNRSKLGGCLSVRPRLAAHHGRACSI